ncbi:hypothetical protein C9J03_20655 [Photobacterium gaetbulicola]|uniref:Uncharacterized protein n=1 Tax=Photobacterium gaetbulicola Gung47 TaxID=658445 RepID=A0A0C5WK12_9GAMM|nr:hypothetical protein [Photobacterium gaetbulicola]AJR06562.1 hypothetical protein H744_1c1542 [Photobacterium gaetbulicola Gung47]PSU03520.1 hypothetical protein C9J03_20655 [Photobacterium gaetbulicola]
MRLCEAKIVIPAHMLPGGVAPVAREFGFEHVEKQRIESNNTIALTQFGFHTPSALANEPNTDKIFDKATEHFLWYLAKGTPYQITMRFTNGSERTTSYVYQDNKLTAQASSLAVLLANSQ